MMTTPSVDPAHDILRYDYTPLQPFFAPRRVAVIGATEKPNSVGRTLLWNLISSPFGGTVFPVNPKRSSVLGIKAYTDILSIPEQIDLAVIAIPAPRVLSAVQQCIHADVRGAIIISAGFKETGEAGQQLEQEILQTARQGNLRIIGPNCLGLMCPPYGLNATFASTMARPGNVGFLSQSGALCTSILDWSLRENVGFSAFVSIGSMLDISWGDLIYHLGDDPHTHSIVIYMEAIGDARSFLSAAREVALSKPIIVIKGGRTQEAAKAAASHTGALMGSDDVLDAAFRRCGVLRVNTIDELFNMAEVLAKQPRPQGNRLTIVTNAGGPGVLATDSLIRGGGHLTPLSPETHQALDRFLPAEWSHHNPIDILGDATPERYAQALEVAAQDPGSDGLLVILTPQAMTDPQQTAQTLIQTAQGITHKPLLASWMGGEDVAAGEALLNQAGLFTLPYPDTAAQVFNLMSQYSYRLRSLYETPVIEDAEELDRQHMEQILGDATACDRTLLSEWESKQFLQSYGIPTVPSHLAQTPEQAVAFAETLGYPVVLKLHSHTITHKTDVGGVHLNLPNAAAVQGAFALIQQNMQSYGEQAFLGVTVQPMLDHNGYELILGSSPDPQFGPVILFGLGGQLVEVFQDRALGLPPLNSTLARRLMEQTKIYQALQGVRGHQSVNLDQLEQILIKFSHLIVEYPQIKEIDINPLLVSEHHIVALDARIILYPQAEKQPIRTAIRPYPSQYVHQWTMGNGWPVTIRPIRPEDEPLIVQFHQNLSEESIYFRYFHLMKLQTRVSHERLTRICFVDYDCEIALVAEYANPQSLDHQILGVARLSKLHGTQSAEFGMLVQDQFQGQGLGTELLKSLLQVGEVEGLEAIKADILPDNRAMQSLCKKMGFQLKYQGDSIEAIHQKLPTSVNLSGLNC
ncbi:bifunctional acetate--CoA ligase family protein/GNAT family N-acetyltransferase [Acaryochloris sp. CCMEE 5410]|uniref:bifunctional acetate--CoA ligase family protein/GNAT family N-acetyltransferase n=1 Tax=Acaryochloris sp. CCMEE 5410 TaxID=310037 RepID=UPI0002E661DE|nr:bifunctional acetate--CoA ligase family protein/GNAT family N-acetyltransferase [Acaryochloris sp. CCMEE 5410]KAI9134669.1 bifunctional acetate--CoA ligase family protein/GNAT family N-acetyltransferase [Acaryochloris sp. CCMEE 5410]